MSEFSLLHVSQGVVNYGKTWMTNQFSHISELSNSTKIESSVTVSPKPVIIGTAAPTDKPTASDQNATGGKNIAGSSAGNTSDVHAATGGDGGKTENTHSNLDRDSGGVKTAARR